MSETPEDPDRAILQDQDSGWTGDPERRLSEEELDRLVDLFGDFEKNREKELRFALERLFRSFVGMAIDERYLQGEDGIETVSKPSTIIARQMKQVQKACETLDKHLAQLDPATRTWLNLHLKKIGTTDENGDPVRLNKLLERISWPIDHLIFAAQNAEGLTSRGPNNVALKIMIEGLANWWEECHGSLPVTDKGRGRQADPFLELCQEMAQITNARLKEKRGGLGSLKLSGLVADVLQNLRTRPRDTSREK